MAKRSSLRASDDDRERVAERLRQAAMEGRLLAHELEERLARTLRAVTYGDLDDVVADLPTPGVAPGRQRRRSAGAFAVARRYPVPAGILALTVAVTVTAVVAAAVAFAMSGIWIIPLVLFFVFRNRGARRAGRMGYAYRTVGRSGRVHAHRW